MSQALANLDSQYLMLFEIKKEDLRELAYRVKKQLGALFMIEFMKRQMQLKYKNVSIECNVNTLPNYINPPDIYFVINIKDANGKLCHTTLHLIPTKCDALKSKSFMHISNNRFRNRTRRLLVERTLSQCGKKYKMVASSKFIPGLNIG